MIPAAMGDYLQSIEVGLVEAIGGMLFALYVGQVLEALGTYTLIFAVAGSVYLIALLIIQLLVPRLEPAFSNDGQ